ncbi:phage Gp37/Gp68 family protein [Methylobacterium nodulans]|uniref:Gp37Gp68 family protein n=1 Tax=Methylobacterium nodulans (strain LMG 21967 / CNCM I-2342 / ORS 2060) TaxID=460265 RepID=B8IRG8_METNO|nr:phage Gp37/Gp68 family protein [Methylobacterium nodulans]ACL58708.1 Gp37Gp68 family protein [Methylobacterium nodulans ORS 2060]
MAENSKIEWCHHTFNPWVGCTRISPACDHCYAEAWAKRTGQPHLWTGERRRTSASNWQQPLKWDRAAAAAGERHRVFCASLADFFDNQVPSRWRDDAWHLINQTPHLDWMLLTKRPQNIAKMLPGPAIGAPAWGEGWPNVWLGTTIEDRARLRNLEALRAVPARVRFLSCEPLLEDLGQVDLTGIHLVIVGGESGPGARPMHPDWARSLRDQCQTAGVAFHFKQHGHYAEVSPEDHHRDYIRAANGKGPWPFDRVVDRDGTVLPGDSMCIGTRVYMRPMGKKAAGRLLDGRTWDQMPEKRHVG